MNIDNFERDKNNTNKHKMDLTAPRGQITITNEDIINEEEEFEDAIEELPPTSKLTKETKEITESNNMREAIETLSRWNSITRHDNTYGLELD